MLPFNCTRMETPISFAESVSCLRAGQYPCSDGSAETTNGLVVAHVNAGKDACAPDFRAWIRA